MRNPRRASRVTATSQPASSRRSSVCTSSRMRLAVGICPCPASTRARSRSRRAVSRAAPTPDIAEWDNKAEQAVESPGDDIEEPDELIETDEESDEESDEEPSSSASPKTPTVPKKKKGPWLAGLLKGSKKKKTKKSAAASTTEKAGVSDAEDEAASGDDVEEPVEAAPPPDEEPADDFFPEPEPSSEDKPIKKTNDDPFDDFLDGLT